MIRKAVAADIDGITDAWDEHFRHEIEHTAYTVFKKGVYPTPKVAQDALGRGALYVDVENGKIAACLIVDQEAPAEYSNIAWQLKADSPVMIIHLIMVRPAMAGKGIATRLVNYAEDLARKKSCGAIRLDTGSQNTPALALYRKTGFKIVATAPMQVGGAIAHREHLFLEKLL